MSKYMGFTRAVDAMSGRTVKGFFLFDVTNVSRVKSVLDEQLFMVSGASKGIVFLGLNDVHHQHNHAAIIVSGIDSTFNLVFSGVSVEKLSIEDAGCRATLPEFNADSPEQPMLYLIETEAGEIRVSSVFECDIDSYTPSDTISPIGIPIDDLTKDQRESLALSYPEHRDALIIKEAITSQNEMYSF